MSDAPVPSSQVSVQTMIEELLSRARSMERGGDLEGLLEEGLLAVKKRAYEEALEARRQAATSPEGEAFPPSGVPELQPPGDEADRR